MFLRLVVLFLVLLPNYLTLAQVPCDAERAIDFCNSGVSVLTADGACSDSFVVCDDKDTTTESVCDPDSNICSHTTTTTSDAVCFSTCTPVCENKECGEDECGGFCGECGSGQGCSNFACVEGLASGTCLSPYNLGNTNTTTIIDTDTRTTIITTGDTSSAVHIETPSCNTLTASPEYIYQFIVPEGRTYGYDIRSFGYDTVLQLMKTDCGSTGYPGNEPEENIVACNDDGTPPADLGSKISGEVTEGTYFVMVDGYSTTDNGPFTLVATFINGCIPLCDGNFCGDDQCGGSCGDCGEGNECNAADNRCYPTDCQPECSTRACGEDGCGGSCGTCQGDTYCLGEAIATEDGTIPPSSCESFDVCNHLDPVCEDCTGSQICGSDCLCYESLDKMADLVVLEEGLLQEMYLQDVDIPESSCSLVEGCVAAPGLRRLLRFTSTVLNQGHVDLSFPEPKDRPDLFEFGACHQHYHFRSFAQYKLLAKDGSTIVMNGKKYAYCMEDTARHFDGANVACEKKYDCGSQGIQRGWLDSYGWSLDCSWLDITDLEPGDYILEIEVNPSRVFAEVTFDNNVASVYVTVPAIEEKLDVPLKLETQPTDLIATDDGNGKPTGPTTTSGGVASFIGTIGSVMLVLIGAVFGLM